VVYVTILWI